jgi:predicted  nucleic acid-binding Zn-ribbon protein
MDPALQAADPLAIATSVAEEMASQPELFGAAAFSPEELETVRIARAGRYNASRTRSEARVAVVVALRQQGASLREIERRTLYLR